MYRNYKRCIGTIKALLGLRVKPFGRVLVPFAAIWMYIDQGLRSVRRACRYLDVYRSTYRYQAKPIPSKQRQLHQRIVALSWQHPRYGYRRIRALLAQEGWPVSRKQVQRIRRKEGLKVSRKQVTRGPQADTHGSPNPPLRFFYARRPKGGAICLSGT